MIIWYALAIIFFVVLLLIPNTDSNTNTEYQYGTNMKITAKDIFYPIIALFVLLFIISLVIIAFDTEEPRYNNENTEIYLSE